MKKGLVILGIVIFVTIISLSLVHAGGEVYTIYLKEPQTWYTPSGEGNTTSEIKVRKMSWSEGLIYGHPIASTKYGEKVYIPMSNITLIVRGESYFSIWKPIEEDEL